MSIKIVLFSWDAAKYSVGVNEIDGQHRVLLDILNELYEEMQQQKNDKFLSLILLRLLNYTKIHFATEDKYFKKYGYPNAVSHKKEHDKFAQKVLELKKDFDSGKFALSVDIADFLKDWFLNHTLVMDQEYAPFIKGKKAK